MLNMAGGMDGCGIHTLFEADAGGIEADDRQSLLDCYSGIAFASPAGLLVGSLKLIGVGR